MRKPVKRLKSAVAYDPTRPLWCLHVPKCGGTTMREIFKQWFPAQDFNTGMCTHFRRGQECMGVEDIQHRYNIVNPQLITQLREPFSWVQSLYWYQRWADPNNTFLHDTKHKLYSLQQFMYFRQHSPEEYLPYGTTAQTILNPCVIVGIYEELDAFMSLVGKWIGQPLSGSLPVLHKTPAYEQQDFREEYKQLRPDLYALYDEAVRRWDAIK